MAKSLKIVTLGCRTNQYESQAIASQLQTLGYREQQEGADLCVINTCTVTEEAHKASKRAVRRALKENPNAKIVVTGCAVETKGGIGEEFAGKIKIVRNGDKEELVSKLYPDADNLPEFKIDQFAAHTRAFIKVQDGCNSYCSYCIIPFVRGRSRSRMIDDVLKEARGLLASGFKEIVLTGINIGDFDGGGTLADLVRQADRLEGLKRLRLSSIDPDEVDDDLTDAIVNGQNTCPSMHVVLQSGSNVTLKRMRRKYTIQEFYRTVEKLRRANPDFTFTTDVIVGFPGETEGDHRATLEVIEEVGFAKVHTFPYSERKGTRAARMEGRLPPETIRVRKSEVLAAAEKGAYALRGNYVGRQMEVLWEATQGEQISGHTANFLRVVTPKKGRRPNTLSTVILTENRAEGLIG